MRNRSFVFWDDNFFGDAEYAAELMGALRGLGRRWAAQVSIDRCRDERLLRLAREAGCVYLFIGLESFSSQGLASVNKAFNQVSAYRETIERIHEHGICVQAGIIFGFDADTTEVFAETLRACEALGVDGVTVSVLTPLPGTQVYAEMAAQGRLTSADWTSFNGKTRVAYRGADDAGGVIRGLHVVSAAILLVPVHPQAPDGFEVQHDAQPDREPGLQVVAVGELVDGVRVDG